MSAQPITLVRPAKQDQVVALMLTVFKANPGVRMARCEVEAALAFDIEEVSESTRQRALNILCNEGHIKYESNWRSPQATIYWLSKE